MSSAPQPRRETVQFVPNSPERVTFAYAGGREYPSQFDESKTVTMYTLQDGRVLWADEVLASKINFADPQAGDSLWITKHQTWNGTGKKRHRHTEWQITTDGSTPAPLRTQPPTQPIRADEMGIDETEIERDLKASVAMRQRAVTRTQARENLARQDEPPAWVDDAPHPAETQRKPAASEVVPMRPPAPRPAQTAQESRQSVPQTQLEAALQTVMAACKSATAYARQIEYQAPPFTSDDIARMAMTLVIGKEQRR